MFYSDVATQLLEVTNGNIKCWRHAVFHNLPGKPSYIKTFQLSQYNFYGGFTNVQYEKIVELITSDNTMKTMSQSLTLKTMSQSFSNWIDYATKVLIPEGLIQFVVQIFSCDRSLAERYLNDRGSVDPCKVFRKRNINKTGNDY